MSDCEKMVDYISKSELPDVERNGMTWVELLALMFDLPRVEALVLAFRYGQAKGFQLAKQVARESA